MKNINVIKEMFPDFIHIDKNEIKNDIMTIFGCNEWGNSVNGELRFSINEFDAEWHLDWCCNITPQWFSSHWDELLIYLRSKGFKKITLCDRFKKYYDYWGKKGFSGNYRDDYRTLYL